MAPGVDLTTCATPGLPLAARAEDGHLMVELLPRLQALPVASTRNSVKFWVVPEESDRTARVIGVLGRLAPELSALIAGSFQVLILPVKPDASLAGMGESEPAKLTVPEARSVRPLPEPPPP